MAFAAPIQSPPRKRGGGLPAVGVLMLVQALSMIGVLAYDLVQGGVSYLPTALGISYKHFVPAPVGFSGSDIAVLLAALTLAFGAFAGKQWTRSAAVVLIVVEAFGAWSVLVNLLTQPELEPVFQPVGHLLLTLSLGLTVLLALVTVIVVTATRTRQSAADPALAEPFDPAPPFPGPGAPAPYGPPPGAPVPGAPAPGAWGAPPPPPGYGAPAGPPQPNPYAGGPGASYAYPPQPPAAPPEQPPQPPQPSQPPQPNQPPNPYR